MNTLADFRRAVESGATLTLVPPTNERHRYLNIPRTAQSCHSQHAVLTPGESRLDYGKSGEWVFGEGTATWTDEHDGYTLVYKVEGTRIA